MADQDNLELIMELQVVVVVQEVVQEVILHQHVHLEEQVIHPQRVHLKVILEVEDGEEIFMELLVAVVELVELEVQLDLVELDQVVQEQQMILQDLV